MTKDQIIAEALALDAKDREAIAEELLMSVTGDSQEEVEKAWAEEIQRRIDAMERGEGSSKPVEEVVRRLRNKKS